jgi:sialate O-acetylesterase
MVLINCTFLEGNAEIRLPAIIGNHMVLQQKNEVNIWGWCEPGEKVILTTTWDTTTYTTKGSSDAKWNLKIKTPDAGGPYQIHLQGNNSITIDDIMIGEVWVCSGQSNMEMSYSWGIKQYADDVANSGNQSIRFFHIHRLTAAYPQDDLTGHWVVCNPEDLKTFSLAGYFFGEKLQKALSEPVGLIEASWGGTPAEVWTPKDSVDSNTDLKKAADKLKPAEGWPIKPSIAYNAMISPITGFDIAGVIWYQGESNVGTASTYHQLFSTMIRSWRQAWQKDFPFYFVQIAPFSGYGENISGPLLQEAQTETLDVPNTGMVVIGDLVTDLKNIHPTDKKDVGYRLANLALSKTYGRNNFAYKYPIFEKYKIENGKINISFSDLNDGLKQKGDTISGFYISGKDEVFKPASAKIEGNTIIVWQNDIQHPVAVRFDFTNSSIPNLFSKEGLPVNLFRTDDWDDVNTSDKK